MNRRTYKEDGKYYAILYDRQGCFYYEGPFNSRSAAYRRSLKGVTA